MLGRTLEGEAATAGASGGRGGKDANSGGGRSDEGRGAGADEGSVTVRGELSARVFAVRVGNARVGGRVSDRSLYTFAGAVASSAHSLGVGRALGADGLTGTKVEEGDATAYADEVEDVGDDTDVSVGARLLGQDIGEDVGSDESSVLKESEVKVETEDLGGRGGRSGEEGEGRDDDASRDHGDWSEVGESEVREKGEKLSEESGGDWGGRSW